MKDTEAKLEEFREKEAVLQEMAMTTSEALNVIENLHLINDELLDFLAVTVCQEQVARAASEED
ncbi:hypothetical protein [Streptomyces sp. NPDC059513]|uniref:hypothetical protein n=1 Tax=unclassified Streptomyces TaxID=2593676 RepID=UPI00368C7074